MSRAKLRKIKEKFPLRIVLVSKPKLRICAGNVAFLGMTLKTRLQEELLVFVWNFRPSPQFTSSTQLGSGKGCFRDRRLPKEVMHPDSTYKKHFETFSVIGKQKRYSRNLSFLSTCPNHNI
jgi:hypothetical protein